MGNSSSQDRVNNDSGEGIRSKQSACLEFSRFAIKESSFAEHRNFVDKVRTGKTQVEIDIVD